MVSDYLVNDHQQQLYENHVRDVEFKLMGRKTTACLITMKNGFEVLGTSSPVNVEDFNEEIGKKFAFHDALNKVDKFIGYGKHMECHNTGVSIGVDGLSMQKDFTEAQKNEIYMIVGSALRDFNLGIIR